MAFQSSALVVTLVLSMTLTFCDVASASAPREEKYWFGDAEIVVHCPKSRSESSPSSGTSEYWDFYIEGYKMFPITETPYREPQPLDFLLRRSDYYVELVCRARSGANWTRTETPIRFKPDEISYLAYAKEPLRLSRVVESTIESGELSSPKGCLKQHLSEAELFDGDLWNNGSSMDCPQFHTLHISAEQPEQNVSLTTFLVVVAALAVLIVVVIGIFISLLCVSRKMMKVFREGREEDAKRKPCSSVEEESIE